MDDLPGGTVTLLFTDGEGSTRLLPRPGGRAKRVGNVGFSQVLGVLFDQLWAR